MYRSIVVRFASIMGFFTPGDLTPEVIFRGGTVTYLKLHGFDVLDGVWEPEDVPRH